MLGLSSIGIASEAWLDLNGGVISYSGVVVRTGTSIIDSKGCGDSMAMMLVMDSIGSIGVEQHSISETVKQTGGVSSAVTMIGTVATGIVAVGVTACLSVRCLELVALDEALLEALDRLSIFCNSSSLVAALMA